MDDESYLEPGFDPNTLRVAELRGILLKHDVDYSSSAKKSVLVDLFLRHVASKAAQIRGATSRVLPSTAGMMDAGNTPDRNESSATPGRRSRRSTRGITADAAEESDEAPARSARKSLGRTPSRKSVGVVENENTPSTVRKSRKSIVMPLEDTVTPRRQDEGASQASDTPFSSYNPFQMGSPPAPVITPGADRRKTVGVPASTSRPRSAVSSRRRTEGVIKQEPEEYGQEPQDYNRAEIVSRTVEPVKKRRQSTRAVVNGSDFIKPEPLDDGLEPGEEFEPSEALELAQEQPQELARREFPRRTSGGQGGNVFLAFILLVLAAYGAWWRNEKIEVGYCGVGGLGMWFCLVEA